MYLNLDSQHANPSINTEAHPHFPGRRPSQNWVVISMTGAGSTAGLFGVDFDAVALGNGCSPAAGTSPLNNGTNRIGPAGGVIPCANTFGATFTQQNCGTNVNP